jgi:putative sterol carrier protein
MPRGRKPGTAGAAKKDEALKSVKTEPKDVTKAEPAAKPDEKPVTKAAEVKTTEVKTDAPKAAAKTAEKTSKRPYHRKKTADVKPTSKSAAKADVAEAKPKARPGRKPKPITIDDICAKLSKKIDRYKVSKIADKIAVDIEVWDYVDGTNKHMYIAVENGKADVQPYDYEDCNFTAHISYANMLNIANGKLSISDAVLNGSLNVIGTLGDALKLYSIF